MKYLVIALTSVVGFFVLFIALSFVIGSDWAAILAAVMMYIGFPILLLRKWKNPWSGKFVKVCNYLIAALLLLCSGWYFYVVIEEGGNILQPLGFFLVWASPALYFIIKGKLPFNASKEDS